VKTLAFGVALAIMAIGTVGILVPSALVWIAQHSLTSGAFYVIATLRVAFGLILISVASASRAPKTLRILGYLILISGVTTALTGLVAIERARVIIEWWSQQGPSVLGLTGVPVLALGGFVAYACAPVRRAA
jgi:presenilin-like A22 family membrane protease